MGVDVRHLLTPMDEPLGTSAGNALEVAEAVECLRGGGPPDTVRLTLDLAEKISKVPRATLARWLQDGTAWKKFVALVEAQGGDAATLERITEVHRAPVIHEFTAPRAGRLTRMDAGQIGRACVTLGAGRTKATDAIDFAVGCDRIAKVGTSVEKGATILRIHARSESSLEATLPVVRNALNIT
jgi:thymidine phosphorylase